MAFAPCLGALLPVSVQLCFLRIGLGPWSVLGPDLTNPNWNGAYIAKSVHRSKRKYSSDHRFIELGLWVVQLTKFVKLLNTFG